MKRESSAALGPLLVRAHALGNGATVEGMQPIPSAILDPIRRVKPAEQIGAVITAIVWVASMAGWIEPLTEWWGIDAEALTGILALLALLAVLARSAYQAWRASGLAGMSRIIVPNELAALVRAMGAAASAEAIRTVATPSRSFAESPSTSTGATATVVAVAKSDADAGGRAEP